MSFTLGISGSAGGSASTLTQAVNPTGDATAGSLIAVFVKHESAPTTITVDDGTTTFTPGTYQSNSSNDSHGQWHYHLSANGGDKTYTATFAAARDFTSIFVFEFTFTGAAAVLDAQSTANGTSANVSSGSMAATGDSGVALGGYIEITINTTSSEQVNGVAADGALRSPGVNFSSAWHKTYAAPFTGAATGTISSAVWACCGIAFKDSGPPATALRSFLNWLRRYFGGRHRGNFNETNIKTWFRQCLT